jgi:hypothetical protein
MTEDEITKWCEQNDETVTQYCRWLNYETGFSGVGTTILDQKPEFEKPSNLPIDVKQSLDNASMEWAQYKKDCFKKAKEEVLGEYDDDDNDEFGALR